MSAGWYVVRYHYGLVFFQLYNAVGENTPEIAAQVKTGAKLEYFKWSDGKINDLLPKGTLPAGFLKCCNCLFATPC